MDSFRLAGPWIDPMSEAWITGTLGTSVERI